MDDEPSNVDLLEQELEAAGYRSIAARDGEHAVALAREAMPDLILLDVMMRGIDGYETCRRLKADQATRSIPVIFLTALRETFEKVRAFELGAVDYVTKPFESEELLARVGTHVSLRREIEAHRRSRATIRMLVDAERGDAIIGDAPALQTVRALVARAGPTGSTVLIQGETGTGKELVARAVHDASPRRDRPMVRVNCAALPRELVESELFGHEKGAFTGATQPRRGRFELADGGSLLLDEIGEMPLEIQAKLLRVLQEGEFERLGGSRSLRVDVRVIAATNRDLRAEVSAGRFRPDLFYRLDVFPIVVPPLRERREDIPALVRHFAHASARRLGRAPGPITSEFLAWAQSYDWPGNVRELQNVIERALIVSPDGSLDIQAAPAAAAGARDSGPLPEPCTSLTDVERAHIQRTLVALGWRIEGEAGAARALGLNPSTLRGRMRKLRISRPG